MIQLRGKDITTCVIKFSMKLFYEIDGGLFGRGNSVGFEENVHAKPFLTSKLSIVLFSSLLKKLSFGQWDSGRCENSGPLNHRDFSQIASLANRVA